MKFNLPQKLLLFASNKHKKFECKNTRIMIILVLNVGIVIMSQNPSW